MKRSFLILALVVMMITSNATGAWAIFAGEPPMPGMPGMPGTPETIAATLDIYPGTINMKSNGKYIKAYIELPSGYDVADIVVGSVMLAGECQADPDRVKIGDKDEDGIPDISVTFSRADLKKASVSGGLTKLTVDGLLLNGSSFSGTDIVSIRK